MKIPDRWLPYTPMGKRIAGTRFISFKVPLKQAYSDKLGENERFTPEMVMEQCPAVQLVIDLTNTSRYYNSNTFTDAGVEYRKILTPGRVIPARRYVLEFFQTVDDFIASSEDDDSLIGVHCTHGLNRTSYFVCCYMIHQLGFDPQDAVAAFEKARGHKIERENYVNDLMNRGMGADTGPQSIVRERYSGPTGPGHRGPQRHNAKSYGDSRSNSREHWNSRWQDPGHRDSRPHGPGHRDSRPNGSANWNPRLNGQAQLHSSPGGPPQWNSWSNGSSQRAGADRRVASSSNWRIEPGGLPYQDPNQSQRHFETPAPSSGRPRNSFHPFGEGHAQQRPQESAQSTQHHSTYKEWRAAKEKANQFPPPNQRAPPNQHQPPNQQRVSSHGSRQRQP